MNDLTKKRCKPCEGGMKPFTMSESRAYLTELSNWELDEKNTFIRRHCQFKNHYETMAFVNAVAWISHTEDHHPKLEIGYNYCVVFYSTHAIKGLSENDFICAAKVDALLVVPDQSTMVCELT